MTRISPFSRSYIRSRSTELMTDYCQVLRPGPGRVVYDPVTKRATNAAANFLYEGACRLWEMPASQAQAYQDAELVISSLFLSLPANAPVPEPEDQIKIVSSDDPSVIGKYFQVISIFRSGGLRAARRLLVQSIESPSTLW